MVVTAFGNITVPIRKTTLLATSGTPLPQPLPETKTKKTASATKRKKPAEAGA
jgi:hypothetical protein